MLLRKNQNGTVCFYPAQEKADRRTDAGTSPRAPPCRFCPEEARLHSTALYGDRSYPQNNRAFRFCGTASDPQCDRRVPMRGGLRQALDFRHHNARQEPSASRRKQKQKLCAARAVPAAPGNRSKDHGNQQQEQGCDKKTALGKRPIRISIRTSLRSLSRKNSVPQEEQRYCPPRFKRLMLRTAATRTDYCFYRRRHAKLHHFRKLAFPTDKAQYDSAPAPGQKPSFRSGTYNNDRLRPSSGQGRTTSIRNTGVTTHPAPAPYWRNTRMERSEKNCYSRQQSTEHSAGLDIPCLTEKLSAGSCSKEENHERSAYQRKST